MLLMPSDPKKARIITVVACTITSLACGSNYGYSIWGPSFAARLKLTATDSNLIGNLGNFGMYAFGIPAGMMVDAKSPRWGLTLGIVLLGFGYYPIARAYDAGPGHYSVPVICFFSFLTGAGSCSAFTASIKAAALNYPESRGTATAFPLAAFGLSALFFAAIAQILPGGTYNFLILLSAGTFLLPLFSFLFIRVIPHHTYQHLAQSERQVLHRTRSSGSRQLPQYEEPGTPESRSNSSATITTSDPFASDLESHPPGDEGSSLLSKTSTQEQAAEDLESSKQLSSDRNHESPHLDIRGFALLPHAEFWQLFIMMGLLTGVGLMTINNIGNDALALWKHFDPTTPLSFIESRQALHVSILSFCSFSGRLLSGIGSDMLVSKLNRSRFWCLFVSGLIFCVAQVVATVVEDPHYLVLVSGLTGIAYGFLFGVYPSLVAHCFGVHGLSQNWGTMTLAPVVSGNVFNLLYGKIYDAHSVRNDDEGHMECLVGNTCYRSAYWVTFAASVLGVACCGWSIWHETQVHKTKGKEGNGSVRSDHERLA